MPETVLERAAVLLVATMEQQGYRLDTPEPDPSDGSVVIGIRDPEVSVDNLMTFSQILLDSHENIGERCFIHTVLVRDGRLAIRIWRA